MRKLVLLGLAALAVGLFGVPAKAAAHEEGDHKFSIHGETRARLEVFDNYDDLRDHKFSGDANDDAFSIWPYRVRIAADGWLTETVRIYTEFQFFDSFGSADTSFPTKGTLPGFENIHVIGQWQSSGSDIDLYQGILEIDKVGGSNFNLRFGRQEDARGTELFMGDNDFYTGTSFEGLRGWWDGEKFDVDGFYYKIDENNNPVPFGGAGFQGSMDTNFWGVTADIKLEKLGNVQPYVLVLQELAPGAVAGGSSLTTFGARWGRMVNTSADVSDNPFDWNIEFATQSGDAGELGTPGVPAAGPLLGCNTSAACDLSGDVIEGWFGYNFTHGTNARSRAHIYFYSASGDEANTVNENEDFNALFGDFHAHNRLGDLDLVDGGIGPHVVTDIALGYQLWIGDGKHMFAINFHNFTMTEDSFLQPAQTGFTRAVDDKIGTEIDLTYGFQWSEHVAVEAGYGTFSPDEAMEAFQYGFPEAGATGLGTGDDVTRGYAQVRARW